MKSRYYWLLITDPRCLADSCHWKSTVTAKSRPNHFTHQDLDWEQRFSQVDPEHVAVWQTVEQALNRIHVLDLNEMHSFVDDPQYLLMNFVDQMNGDYSRNHSAVIAIS